MREGAAVFGGSLIADERIVGADGEGKGGGGEAGLPASIPGANHDGDGEDDEAALREIREDQRWNQSQERAEEGDSIAQNGSAGRSDRERADEGEFHSHEFMLCVDHRHGELRWFTAISWRQVARGTTK